MQRIQPTVHSTMYVLAWIKIRWARHCSSFGCSSADNIFQMKRHLATKYPDQLVLVNCVWLNKLHLELQVRMLPVTTYSAGAGKQHKFSWSATLTGSIYSAGAPPQKKCLVGALNKQDVRLEHYTIFCWSTMHTMCAFRCDLVHTAGCMLYSAGVVCSRYVKLEHSVYSVTSRI
jgi:hypothetical protein